MSESVKPAMTEEEWERRELRWASNGLQFWVQSATREIGQYQTDDWELYIGASARGNSATQCHKQQHGIAALALYGQPFGFTRDDVNALRVLARTHLQVGPVTWQELDSLADRIESLLPPEKK